MHQYLFSVCSNSLARFFQAWCLTNTNYHHGISIIRHLTNSQPLESVSIDHLWERENQNSTNFQVFFKTERDTHTEKVTWCFTPSQPLRSYQGEERETGIERHWDTEIDRQRQRDRQSESVCVGQTWRLRVTGPDRSCLAESSCGPDLTVPPGDDPFLASTPSTCSQPSKQKPLTPATWRQPSAQRPSIPATYWQLSQQRSPQPATWWQPSAQRPSIPATYWQLSQQRSPQPATWWQSPRPSTQATC